MLVKCATRKWKQNLENYKMDIATKLGNTNNFKYNEERV